VRRTSEWMVMVRGERWKQEGAPHAEPGFGCTEEFDFFLKGHGSL
jgi:hypothetical protein